MTIKRKLLAVTIAAISTQAFAADLVVTTTITAEIELNTGDTLTIKNGGVADSGSRNGH